MVTSWRFTRYFLSLNLPLTVHLNDFFQKWDADNTTWQRVGEVVDAVGQGRKQLYQGKEYDYVFDVDIQDGVPPLKLPYNVTGKLVQYTMDIQV